MIAPAAPTALSPELLELKAMAASVAAVRQSVDQLGAGQQQMAGGIANLLAADQDILHKISAPPQISAPPPRPAAPPAHKPVPLTPPPSSEAARLFLF